MNKRAMHASRGGGFTLLEVLVVVTIIAVLASILIPVVGRVRDRARAADTQNMLSQLSNACTNYYQDFKSYPGPLGNNEINNAGGNLAYPVSQVAYVTPAPTGYDLSSQPIMEFRNRLTMSENLVLGLLGGLKLNVSGGTPVIEYDPSQIGTGPNSLNPANPKKYTAYADPVNLSWRTESGLKMGTYADEAAPNGIADTIVPEFVDRFSDPMPVLYLRAKRGVGVTINDNDNNAVVTNDPNFTNGRPGTYDLSQIIAYTQSTAAQPPIGAGKRKVDYKLVGSVPNAPNPPNAPYHHGLRTVNVNVTTQNPPPTTPSGLGFLYPYDAYAYLRNPALSSQQASEGNPAGTQVAREKDKFILISAGSDRTYGTNDDITTFGSVGQ